MDLQVNFDLGEYGEYPDLEDFSIREGDVRVKKNPGNFCEIFLNGDRFETNVLELELSGGGWIANAIFDIPLTREYIDVVRSAIVEGQAKLRLGEYQFTSSEIFNEHIFTENYFDFDSN